MAHDVFISYSSSDQKLVEALSHFLEERGVRCFVAYRDIPPGSVWAGAITQAIENCRLMVVVFSKAFNASTQVDREIELCAEEKKPILTFRIQNEGFKGAKKFYLKNINWIDAFPNPSEYFQSLYESVVKLIGANVREDLINNSSELNQGKLRFNCEDSGDLRKCIEKEQKIKRKKSNLKLSKWLILPLLILIPLISYFCFNQLINKKGDYINSTTNRNSPVEIINSVTSNMVEIEGGTFIMGSPENEQFRCKDEVQHKVTLSSYYISKIEVTMALWEAVMNTKTVLYKGDNYPIDSISWFDAVKFCNELSRLVGMQPAYSISGSTITLINGVKGFRLPTEAEWEFAARGGNQSKGFMYAGSNDLDKVAWYKDNNNGVYPVGQKQPNELGLYDMSGNVSEWCWDWYGSYCNTSQSNPYGPESRAYRVYRGGGWNFAAKYCRLTFRNYSTPELSFKRLGFRLALTK